MSFGLGYKETNSTNESLVSSLQFICSKIELDSFEYSARDFIQLMYDQDNMMTGLVTLTFHDDISIIKNREENTYFETYKFGLVCNHDETNQTQLLNILEKLHGTINFNNINFPFGPIFRTSTDSTVFPQDFHHVLVSPFICTCVHDDLFDKISIETIQCILDLRNYLIQNRRVNELFVLGIEN